MDFLFGSAAGHLTGIERLNPDTGLVEFHHSDADPAAANTAGRSTWTAGRPSCQIRDGAPFVGVTPVRSPGRSALAGVACGVLLVGRRWRSARHVPVKCLSGGFGAIAIHDWTRVDAGLFHDFIRIGRSGCGGR